MCVLLLFYSSPPRKKFEPLLCFFCFFLKRCHTEKHTPRSLRQENIKSVNQIKPQKQTPIRRFFFCGKHLLCGVGGFTWSSVFVNVNIHAGACGASTHMPQYLFTMAALWSAARRIVRPCLCVNKQTLRESLFAESQQGPTELTFPLPSQLRGLGRRRRTQRVAPHATRCFT